MYFEKATLSIAQSLLLQTWKVRLLSLVVVVAVVVVVVVVVVAAAAAAALVRRTVDGSVPTCPSQCSSSRY